MKLLFYVTIFYFILLFLYNNILMSQLLERVPLTLLPTCSSSPLPDPAVAVCASPQAWKCLPKKKENSNSNFKMGRRLFIRPY